MEHKKFENHLGIWGWILGGRWGIERYVYTIHRITGLGLLFYFLLHIGVTSLRALGQSYWEKAMDFVHHPVFLVGEYLVYLAFAFHAMNGFRLIVIELGLGVGKPEEPVYPYKTSLHVQRPLLAVCMMFTGVLALLGAYNLIQLIY